MDRYKTLKLVADGELHSKLKEAAKAENVSLNTYIIYQLALLIGKPKSKKKKHQDRLSTVGFDHLFEEGTQCQ